MKGLKVSGVAFLSVFPQVASLSPPESVVSYEVPLSRVLLSPSQNVPVGDELVFRFRVDVLSGGGVAFVRNDWQLLVFWRHSHLKVQPLTEQNGDGEVAVWERSGEGFIGEHVEKQGEVSLSALRKHQFRAGRLQANGWHRPLVVIVATEGDFDLARASDDAEFIRHLEHSVAIDNRGVCVPAGGSATGQRCLEYVVGRSRGSLARGVEETKAILVQSGKESLGQSDWHIVLCTADRHSLSCNNRESKTRLALGSHLRVFRQVEVKLQNSLKLPSHRLIRTLYACAEPRDKWYINGMVSRVKEGTRLLPRHSLELSDCEVRWGCLSQHSHGPHPPHNVCYSNGVPVCQSFVHISPFDYRGAVVNLVFCQWLPVSGRDQHSTFTRVVVGAERGFRVGAGTAVSPRDVGARMAAASVVRQTLVDIWGRRSILFANKDLWNQPIQLFTKSWATTKCCSQSFGSVTTQGEPAANFPHND